LALLGVVYVGEGLFRACFGPLPQDLARRWLEGSYLARGINGLDVYEGVRAPEPDLGPMHPGGYPPWATALGLLVVPPLPQALVRWYFAVLNVGALALIVRYAYRTGLRHGRGGARLLAASVLAIASNAVVLRHGQYGILVNAFLALMLHALESGRLSRAGIWLGLAALKPQSSGPFALIFLRHGRTRALVSAALLGGVATAFASLWTGRSPIALLGQVFGQAAQWEGGDSGLLRLLLEAGIAREAAIPLLAVVSLVAGGVLLHRYRHASLPIQVGIMAVVGRLWAYHRRYDDMLLLFLLLPLGQAALARPTHSNWSLFFAVGLTLWLPFREADHGVVLIAVKVSLWVGGLAWLLHGVDAEVAQSNRSSARAEGLPG
jgi:hypothetical protein